MMDTAQKIIAARRQNPGIRDRDFARSAGISEAELVAAWCAAGEARRVRVDLDTLLEHAPGLGTVVALTRNESAVHETTGRFGQVFPGRDVALTLGEIDLRIFPKQWCSGFARDMEIHGKQLKSLQFFDHQGTAVFKLYEQEGSDRQAWIALVDRLVHEDQPGRIQILPEPLEKQVFDREPDVETFRRKWSAMTDVHQLHGILQEMKISRHDAVKLVGREFAHELSRDAIALMLLGVAEHHLPILCFAGNHGCIQIYTGPVGPVRMSGPWLDLLDDRFHLHLHLPDVAKVWSVRKPVKDGLLHSLEVFDKKGDLIVQFFGEREEGRQEREGWRTLMASLPAAPQSAVA